jgi:protein-disulfide isomerase
VKYLRETSRVQTLTTSKRRRAVAIAAFLVILGVIIASFIFIKTPSSASQPVVGLLENTPSLGSPDAKVTLIEYGDFGCPTCKNWFNAGVLNQIRAKYGDRVHFIWVDFPVITPQSPKADEAGQCANDQGNFWQYHDLLYQHAPALSISDLKSYANAIGLDTAKFNQCLDSGKFTQKVNAETQNALQHNFMATPSFLLNDKPLLGPPSFAYLVSLIDPLLGN